MYVGRAVVVNLGHGAQWTFCDGHEHFGAETTTVVTPFMLFVGTP